MQLTIFFTKSHATYLPQIQRQAIHELKLVPHIRAHMSHVAKYHKPWLPEYKEYVVFVPRIFHIHTDFSYF